MALKSAPPYVEGHNLLVGKSVMITAAAGAGIGFAAAKRREITALEMPRASDPRGTWSVRVARRVGAKVGAVVEDHGVRGPAPRHE